MAIQTRSIQAGGGGDYTTIAAWEAAAPTLGTDIWKGEIDDNSEYNESVTLSAAGTPSATSYLWLTGGASNRHSGVVGTGHPRLRSTTGHCFIVDTSHTRVEWLEVELDSGGGSDEAFRINSGVDDLLFSHLIIYSGTPASDQDGFYTGSGSNNNNITIDNCFIYGWRRAGIHPQQFGGSPGTQVWNIDHCGIFGCGENGEDESGAICVRSEAASDSITVNLNNTWGMFTQRTNGGVMADFRAGGGGGTLPDPPVGTVTWNGSHNLFNGNFIDPRSWDGTDNTTNLQVAIDGVTSTSQTTGDWLVVESMTLGSENLLLLDDEDGNLAAGNGTNRQGSEPDARQDFSVDITGGTRPTTGVDVGPHQVSGAAFSSASLLATGDGTIVDVVNESDAASPLSPSVDDDPASPDDNDWVNNAVDVVP